MQSKAFGYIRVSGKGQVKGDGFMRQEKAILDYAQTKGIEVTKFYREKGVSGTLANRPALAELIVDLEKKRRLDTNFNAWMESIDEEGRNTMLEAMDRLMELCEKDTITLGVDKNGIPNKY